MIKKVEKENKEKNEENILQVYEVGYHIVPAVPMENIANEVENIKNFLVKEGAEIISEEFPKILELSYSIKKSVGGMKRNFNTAYFGWIKFDAKENSTAKIKKFFDENENILRFLFIKTVKEDTLFSSREQNTVSSKEETPPSKNKSSKEDDLLEKETKISLVSREELDKTIDKLIAE